MLGRKNVSRAALETAFLRAGAAQAMSFAATGNVVFDAPRSKVDAIVASATRSLRAEIGLEQPIFVRSMAALKRLYALDPFRGDSTDEAFEFCVTFLPYSTVRPTLDLPYISKRKDLIVLRASGPHIFSVTRLINGRPGYAGPWLERQLKTRVTTRNWRTLKRLLRFADA